MSTNAARTNDPWVDLSKADRMLVAQQVLLDGSPGLNLTASELMLLKQLPQTLTHDQTIQGSEALAVLGLPDVSRHRDGDATRLAFEIYLQNFDGALNRARNTETPTNVAIEIGWWLGHRWLQRDLDPSPLGYLKAAAAAVSSQLASSDSRAEHDIRVEVVTGILALTSAMSYGLDSTADFIGDHLGITDPVDAAMIRDMADQIEWKVAEGTLTLVAQCSHPVLEVALREHCERIAPLLNEVSHLGTALVGLPYRVNVDIRATTAGGEAAYLDAGVRFHLAEDRIRELLMGERLYGDKGLAIRELYQNAVDACRHRQARMEYLARAMSTPAPVDHPQTQAGQRSTPGTVSSPQVTFVQGIDPNGREYIDCTDVGIGMGLHEIANSFCQAGVRSADLPEFIEELSDFASLNPPVELWTNSRFGIGALSYFMLADELTLTTTRTHRDGSLGHTYQVTVPGPGTYFRITDLGPGRTPGTTVRLWLRPESATSCIEELSRVLAVASLNVTAQDDRTGESESWEPHELKTSVVSSFLTDELMVAVPEHQVWWTGNEGTILADGLVAGGSLEGVVVNLSGRHAPELSVNRKQMLSYDEEQIAEQLRTAVPRLVKDSRARSDIGLQPFTSNKWLIEFSWSQPDIADLICESISSTGPLLETIDEQRVDLAKIGPSALNDIDTFNSNSRVASWRISAMLSQGAFSSLNIDTSRWPEIVKGLPTDGFLLNLDIASYADPIVSTSIPLHRIAYAAIRSSRSIAAVVRRVEELGYAVPDGVSDFTLDPADGKLLIHIWNRVRLAKLELDSETEPIFFSVFDLHAIAQAIGMDPLAVGARLRALGFECAELVGAGCAPPSTSELLAASENLNGRRPWLLESAPIGLGHIWQAAKAANASPAKIHAGLLRLGFAVPELPETFELSTNDLTLLSENTNSRPPWLPVAPVAIVHLIRVANKTGQSLLELMDRVGELGIEILPFDREKIELVTKNYLIAYDEPNSNWMEVLPLDVPVSPVHVSLVIQILGLDPGEVTDTFQALGYEIGGGGVDINSIDDIDIALVADGFSSDFPARTLQDPISTAELIGRSWLCLLPADVALQRFRALGYEVTVDPENIPDSSRLSAMLASRNLDNEDPWVAVDEVVPANTVILAAIKNHLTADEALARYRNLGIRAEDPAEFLPVTRPGPISTPEE